AHMVWKWLWYNRGEAAGFAFCRHLFASRYHSGLPHAQYTLRRIKSSKSALQSSSLRRLILQPDTVGTTTPAGQGSGAEPTKIDQRKCPVMQTLRDHSLSKQNPQGMLLPSNSASPQRA